MREIGKALQHVIGNDAEVDAFLAARNAKKPTKGATFFPMDPMRAYAYDEREDYVNANRPRLEAEADAREEAQRIAAALEYQMRPAPMTERDLRDRSAEQGPQQVAPGDLGDAWKNSLLGKVAGDIGTKIEKGLQGDASPEVVTSLVGDLLIGNSALPGVGLGANRSKLGGRAAALARALEESANNFEGVAKPSGRPVPERVQRANAPKSVETTFANITDPDEAMRVAVRGGHLKLDGDGKYIGLGDHINSPQALGALRNRVDQLVANGSWNADWYIRHKELARALSDDKVMQSQFARGTAAYSPQAMPKVELPTFINQHNAKMLTGEDTIPRTGSQSRNVARAYGQIGDNSVRYDIDPGAIRLGKKTGPYADKKDPNVEGGYKTASDVWHARSFELNDPNNIGGAGHGVLTGENLLLGKRANEAGVPVGSQPAGTLHDASTAQAATWGAERVAALAAEDAARFTKQSKAREVYERDPARWRKRNPDKSPPPKPKPVRTEAELRAYGSTGLDTALPDQLAYISKEAVTGAGLGHGEMPGHTMAEMPDPWKADYTARHKAATGRDPMVEALQLYSQKPVDTVGEWTPKGRPTEYNPGWADPVVVSNQKTNMGRGTPQVERDALALAAQLEGYLGAQNGVGVNRIIDRGLGNTRLKDTNSLRVDLRGRSDQEIADMRAFARANNLNEVNVGDHSVLVRFGAAGPEPGIGKEIDKLAGTDPRMAPFTRLTSRLESDLVGSGHVNKEGTGKATRKLLKAFNDSGIPNVYQRVDAGRLPSVAAARNAIDEEMLKAKGLPVRADLMKAREILAGGGLTALKAFVKKNGAKGLPAALLPMLDMTPSPESRE